MNRLIAIESFESSDIPVVAVGCDGVVRYSNGAAADLFAGDGEPLIGRVCWRTFRLRTREGGAFCRRDCPLRLHEERGRARSIHEVALPAGAAPPRRFDLLTFPTGTASDSPILHVLVPSPDACGRHTCSAMTSPSVGCRRLHLLTAREMEVLELLADGFDPATVASRLGIRLVTVRNHIRNTLRKLKLHRQVDAVLALLERSGRRGPGVE
jgi:DNA-binding CsgD family transcriptional regulator